MGLSLLLGSALLTLLLYIVTDVMLFLECQCQCVHVINGPSRGRCVKCGKYIHRHP